MTLKVVSTDNAPGAIGPYSQAISVGDFVFTSGQLPLTAKGDLAGSTIEEQTHQVLLNIESILKAAGLSMNQVIKTTVYLQDMNDFSAVNAIYAKFFSSENYPARSALEVTRLAKDAKIEIEAIAFKG